MVVIVETETVTKCKTPQIVYWANVSNNFDHETKYYYGFTAPSFNERYCYHKSSFSHKGSTNTTELSKYVRKLQKQGKVWDILKKEMKKPVQNYVNYA